MIELIKSVIKSLILMNRLGMGSGKNAVYLILIFWKHIVFTLSIWISSINIRQRFQCMFDNRVNIRLRSIFLWRFELLIGLCLWPVEFCLWQLAVHLLKYNVLKGWNCYRTSFGWLLFLILFIKVWIVLLISISFYHS